MSGTVVVTGAAGRIGRRLVTELRESGCRVRGVDRQPCPGFVDTVSDLSDYQDLSCVVKGADTIVHLAALMSWQDGDAAALFHANALATFNLLEVNRTASAAEVILASSGEVYPETAPQYLPITESHPTEPRTHYGMTKLLTEQMAWFYSRRYAIPTTVLRFPHTQDASELLDPESPFSGPRFFLRKRIEQKRQLGDSCQLPVLEAHNTDTERLLLSRSQDGIPYRMPICDTRDTVQGIALAITTPEARGEVIALGPEAPCSFDIAVPYMSELTGLGYVDLCLPGAGPDYAVDITKARRLLNYKPHFTIERMVAEAAAAYHERASTSRPLRPR